MPKTDRNQKSILNDGETPGDLSFHGKDAKIKGFLGVGRLVVVCCRLSTIEQMDEQVS